MGYLPLSLYYHIFCFRLNMCTYSNFLLLTSYASWYFALFFSSKTTFGMFLPLIFAELDCLAYFLTCVALKSKRTIKNVHIINYINHPKILVHSTVGIKKSKCL